MIQRPQSGRAREADRPVVRGSGFWLKEKFSGQCACQVSEENPRRRGIGDAADGEEEVGCWRFFAGVAVLFIVIFTVLRGMAIADRFWSPFLRFAVCASGIAACLCIVLTAPVAG